jgi:hypothetical protein
VHTNYRRKSRSHHRGHTFGKFSASKKWTVSHEHARERRFVKNALHESKEDIVFFQRDVHFDFSD